MHRTNGFISVQYKYYLDNVRERERERGGDSQPDGQYDRHTPTVQHELSEHFLWVHLFHLFHLFLGVIFRLQRKITSHYGGGTTKPTTSSQSAFSPIQVPATLMSFSEVFSIQIILIPFCDS